MHTGKGSRGRLRRAAVVTGCAAVAAGALWGFRGWGLPWASARQPGVVPPPAVTAPGPQAAPSGELAGDYASRVVAYIHESKPVTRQELGEYLIARHGMEKVGPLLNRKIIDSACRARGIEVNPAEVDLALAEELKASKIDIDSFVKTVLPRYKKSLYEWKEDVIRPRLMLERMCRKQVACSAEDLRDAFESAYGEKIECRMILWPANQEQLALQEYAKLRDSEDAFAERAKKQPLSALAATGGKLKPFGRHTMGDENLEREAFKLKPGEVSTLVRTPQGFVILKCDKRIPADTTASFEAVREKLTKEVLEKKVQAEMAGLFQALRDQAKPQVLLKKTEATPATLPSPKEAVGYIHGNQPVTREDLGEFLIARYGTETVELLVNRRIIDEACQERGINVSEAEVDAGVAADLKALGVDRQKFEKDLLGKYGKTFFEWREDVVRPRLILRKLAQGRVSCTDEDLRKAFEASYGEKIEARIILWPSDQAKAVLQEYNLVRSSEEEFDRKARSQVTPSLASKGGKLPAFGRHSLDNDDLEREAFKLSPGEVSILVGTPQGQVALKCDKRLPADATVKLDQVRDKLTAEVMEKKTQVEMQTVFNELRDRARPRLLLKDPNRPEDLLAETRRLLSDLPPLAGPGAAVAPPVAPVPPGR